MVRNHRRRGAAGIKCEAAMKIEDEKWVRFNEAALFRCSSIENGLCCFDVSFGSGRYDCKFPKGEGSGRYDCSAISCAGKNIVKLKKGKKTISLVSATVGLPVTQVKNGILGPVKLIAPNSAEKDLSENQLAYKVGLKGLESELQLSKHAPAGEVPVVLDLLGLGKGAHLDPSKKALVDLPTVYLLSKRPCCKPDVKKRLLVEVVC
ncbi:hypothetical protein LguiB_000842 [Lonicera macranthoides]